jgi:hypothetical protein
LHVQQLCHADADSATSLSETGLRSVDGGTATVLREAGQRALREQQREPVHGRQTGFFDTDTGLRDPAAAGD